MPIARSYRPVRQRPSFHNRIHAEQRSGLRSVHLSDCVFEDRLVTRADSGGAMSPRQLPALNCPATSFSPPVATVTFPLVDQPTRMMSELTSALAGGETQQQFGAQRQTPALSP